jgi:hypothetical protein
MARKREGEVWSDGVDHRESYRSDRAGGDGRQPGPQHRPGRGTPTAVHNRTTAKMTEFMKDYGDEGPFTGCETVEDFVNALAVVTTTATSASAGRRT